MRQSISRKILIEKLLGRSPKKMTSQTLNYELGYKINSSLKSIYETKTSRHKFERFRNAKVVILLVRSIFFLHLH